MGIRTAIGNMFPELGQTHGFVASAEAFDGVPDNDSYVLFLERARQHARGIPVEPLYEQGELDLSGEIAIGGIKLVDQKEK